MSTGIAFGLTVAGWVPDFEIYSAMRHAGHVEDSWGRLAWPARARAVAHYRLAQLVTLHQSDAVARAARRPSNA